MTSTRVLRSIRRKLAAKQGGLCHYCKCQMTDCDGVSPTSLTLDHVIPLALGGTNHRSNMVAACFACNQNKADKLPFQPQIKRAKRRKTKRVPADFHIQMDRAAAKAASRWNLHA